MSNILITGCAGFIGSHLCEFFANQGHNIIALDRLDSTTTCNRLTSIDNWNEIQSHVKFVWWDLKSPLSPYVIQEIGNIDIILHLAAQSHVDRSIVDPLSFVMDNVVGTCNLLNYATLVNPKQIIYFSTDEVMGASLYHAAYRETDATHPENPYAATKAGAESLCIAYACTYSLPIIITRCMNVYGIKQNYEKFIPLTIKNILDKKKITIHADETRTIAGSRHYLSIPNLCSAINFILIDERINQIPLGKISHDTGIYNIIGEREVDNLELAEKIAKIMNRPLIFELVDYHSSRPGHDLKYKLSGTKLGLCGWYPGDSFDSELERVVNWYLDHPNWLLS